MGSLRILLLVLIFPLMLVSCKADGGYLPMPEQYLGYWQPYARTLAGVGVDVSPDTIVWRSDPDYHKGTPPEDLFTQHIDEYKVFFIDDDPNHRFTDQFVYAISRQQITSEWLENSLRQQNRPEEEIIEILAKPRVYWYQYYRFSISDAEYDQNKHFLHISDRRCKGGDVTEDDWHRPAHFHRQRIFDGYCALPDGVFDHLGTTWHRNNAK